MRRWLLASAVAFALTLTTAVVARQGPGQGRAGGGPGQAAPVTGTGVIAGRVMDASDGSPIGEAIVTLSLPETGPIRNPPARVASDPQGRFLFRDLPAGTFSLITTATGYVQGGVATARPNGPTRPVTLDDGAHADVVVKLFKYAAISGMVVDEAGDPVCNDTVRIFPVKLMGGRRKLTSPIGTSEQTDDRGIFRTSSLLPGDYVIAHVASPISMPASALVDVEQARGSGSTANQAFARELAASGATLLNGAGNVVGDWRLIYGTSARPPAPTDDGRVFVYPTVFFPAATSPAGASVVTVKSGEERTGVNFQLRPAPAVRVSGTVVGPNGPVARIGLRLITAEINQFATESTIDPAVTMTAANGAFTFLGMSPGSYTLKAVKTPVRREQGEDSTEPSLWATLPLQVGETDVIGVQLALRTGARVSGRLEFDGAAAVPGADGLQMAVEIFMVPGVGASGKALSFFQSWRGGATGPNRTFQSAQLPPGRYFIGGGGTWPGWTLESVVAGGRDVLDVPVEIGATDLTDVVLRYTDRPAKLTGIVRDPAQRRRRAGRGRTVHGQSAVLDGLQHDARRIRLVTTTATGAFTSAFRGEYYLVALKDTDAGELPDQKLLERLAIGTAQHRCRRVKVR